MGFCSEEELEEFFRSCPEFERMLVRSGIILVKYWFSVSDEVQEERFLPTASRTRGSAGSSARWTSRREPDGLTTRRRRTRCSSGPTSQRGALVGGPGGRQEARAAQLHQAPPREHRFYEELDPPDPIKLLEAPEGHRLRAPARRAAVVRTGASTDVVHLMAPAAEPLADALQPYVDVDRTPRPGGCWVLSNMVAGLDGTAAISGRVGALSSPRDAELFRRLRSVADVVLVGAETVRRERYGPIRLDEDLLAARRQRGQAAPRFAVVSASLDLDPDLPLFARRRLR